MMEVELFDLASRTPCALDEVCGVVGMIYHGNPIAHGTCTITITCIKKGSTKVQFPNSAGSKMKDMANGIVLWCEKDITIIK
jgi:hypothetical protein